jgi:hypothetical protein
MGYFCAKQLNFAHGRCFSLGTQASSITKTGNHDIVEILLKVALNTKNQKINQKNIPFNSPCQRQCELLPSLGVCHPLTFHILIFSSETA